MLRRLLIALGLLLCVAPTWAGEVTLGVLAYDGKEQALQRWQPTADYLGEQMPEHRFRILPLTHEDFEHALNKGELDFVLTNPGHYVQLEVRYGITRIATFLTVWNGQPLKHFSSVIFTRRGSSIERLDDLRGVSFAAVSEGAFSGFQLAQDALKQQGIDALRDMKPVWLGFPHADVVRAVLQGRAQAGTVRSGVLEKMQAAGELDLAQLNILAARQSASFPLIHSVGLYPEWPFAKLPDTDIQLAKQVAMALFAMPQGDAAAQQAGGAGWTIPLNYAAVHEVLRRLQVDPYPPQPLSWGRIWQAYRPWVLALAGLFLFAVAMLLRYVGANARLRRAQQALQQHQTQLEDTVQRRTEELHRSNTALREEVAFHREAENTLHQGCETLQSLYAIFARDDLSRQQRLNSVVEAVRLYLGADRVLLSRVEGEVFTPCSVSPATAHTPAPLAPSLAEQAIEARKATLMPQEDGEQQYIACPVFVKGELRCLLELQADAPGEDDAFSSELGMNILTLVSQWLGFETVLLAQEEEQASRQSDTLQRFEAITPREKDVLALLVQGESSKSMARRLQLSPKTVEMHRANLLRKTQARSSTELVQLAVSSGVLQQ